MRCLHSLLGATQVGGLLLIAAADDDADVAVPSGEVADDVKCGTSIFVNPQRLAYQISVITFTNAKKKAKRPD